MSDHDVVIRVEGLGKKYSLHHEQPERYTALRDVWVRQAKAAGRWLNPFTLAGQLRQTRRHAGAESGASEEEFWALKDVSFEIRRGERVGIIGRNGAGKSTLLKILSRITEPTTGRVEIRGRVASLLEVGTGFHPELTGRENIYLNGAILGMTRREIRAKFDEIVDFAEVEKFLDTPVKRYSSGMYVRLAFAVAAHLEPEILVVDEVLAVGDASFQKKCLGKMDSISKEHGRTILFVSHNMPAISNLCSQGIFLSAGQLVKTGLVAEVLSSYFSQDVHIDSAIDKRSDRRGTGIVRFKAIKLFQFSKNVNTLVVGSPAQISLMFERSNKNSKDKYKLDIAIGIDTFEGVRVAHLSTDSVSAEVCLASGDQCGEITFNLDPFNLAPGSYSLTLFLRAFGDISDWLMNAYSFEVETSDFYNTGKLPPPGQGYFLPFYSIC